MIKSIGIKNFKSHKDTHLEFKNLSVLCGGNGVGKSSASQLLLLLREAYIKDSSFDILDLKSNPVKIGTANDAIYQFSEFDGFQINLALNEQDFKFIYEIKNEQDRTKTFIRLDKETSEYNHDGIDNISLFNTDFQYISAARLGPQEQYFKDDKIVDVYKQISVIDGNAAYFVHFLDAYRNEEVINELCIVNEESKYTDLFSQVIAWERKISEGINIVVEDTGKLGYLLKYNFVTELSTTKRTNDFEATNVGFGLSYVMPIIVAILSSKPGSLLIIENPEAHLHPHGIAGLSELICMASQAGIQIILETHSDHIVNGILVQCKKYEESGIGIDRHNVNIFQFERNSENHSTEVKKIDIEDDGRVRYAPEGFFDQFTMDRKYLMGF